ncbi:hypothetical protein RND71_011740 [Anisodus tanguticus]|uniref:Uncharacterized protein n=1 Tax=Anisodus tanguticus TaxID=243964 RepID=A0AAE1SC13_9SOLA|nr:hypothetical protein RND71_011740 [Anisodus tanguticus]
MTALHLAASEGHASIVELLLAYKADVNLKDRWRRTPLTDAKLYGHRDICRILEVCGGKDSNSDHPLTVRHEGDSIEVNIDISELNMQHSSMIEQVLIGTNHIIAHVEHRGMNYLHRHKPLPIVHNNLHPKFSTNTGMLQMVEGRQVTDTSSEPMHVKSVDLEKKLYTGQYPSRILQLSAALYLIRLVSSVLYLLYIKSMLHRWADNALVTHLKFTSNNQTLCPRLSDLWRKSSSKSS